MEYVIELLQKERETTISALKNGQNEKMRTLQQIDQAIGWLSMIQDHHLGQANKYDLHELPYIEGYGGFTCYRIMIDKETDNTEDWEEYKRQDGGHYELSMGDFLLVHR